MYLAKARNSFRDNGGDEIAIEVLDDFFKTVNKNVRGGADAPVCRTRPLGAVGPICTEGLQRKLSDAEREHIVEFYRRCVPPTA